MTAAKPRMKILFVSVEVAPFAKVGGLADVAGSLPKALRELGHDVRVIMPLYKMIEDDPRWHLETVLPVFDVQMSRHWHKTAVYKQTTHEGVPTGFIGTDEWFTQSVNSETVYQPGGMQHLFLGTAILEVLRRIDWIPDVIHCHDWHTGFLPVILREKASAQWDSVATVYSIHNLAYQGEFGMEVIDALELPHSVFHPEKVEAWGRVNFLKAGCAYADRVNTVSPNYAREIQTPEYGCTLQGLMSHLNKEGRLAGILNGIHTERFDPATDPDIPAHFTAQDSSGKATCRAELLKEVGLPEIEGAPVVGMVSRLSNQKGFDLVLAAADEALELPMQLVLLAVGDPVLAAQFKALQKRNPDRVKIIERFDAALAQRVYAGCDAFLMPSSFEPCGLGQLIALRYGTVPVVRSTGGLADTVFEGKNGFVFEHRSPMELLAALTRMHDTFVKKDKWAELMKTGMTGDYSWTTSAKHYEDLYKEAVSERSQLLTA